MLYSINWPNLIVLLPLPPEILINTYIEIFCEPGSDVINNVLNFEISLIFLIKSLLFRNTKSRQKPKYLENKKSFYSEMNSIFHYF